MKKLTAMLLSILMLLGMTALAAEWPAGCSPAKPYTKVDQVDLSKTMGYLILYPREKVPVEGFCDVLEMFLPREDIVRGTGRLTVYENVAGQAEPVEFCHVDFSNPDSVEFRLLDESELESLMWGSGVCIDVHLPKSLEYGAVHHDYFVLMDEGCFVAANGTVQSIGINANNAWKPIISGAYGISGLYYVDAPYQARALGTPEPEALPNAGINNSTTEAESAQAPSVTPQPYAPVVQGMDGQLIQSVDGIVSEGAVGVGADGGFGVGAGVGAEENVVPAETVDPSLLAPEAPAVTPIPTATSPDQYVVKADAGDVVHFDVIMGGDAVVAIPYSENGSVEFETVEFTQTSHVVGSVISDDVEWGVVFLNDQGDVIHAYELGR